VGWQDRLEEGGVGAPTKRRRRPLVWGPVVVEQVRFELLINSPRIGPTAP
jgi:hypothetical protein